MEERGLRARAVGLSGEGEMDGEVREGLGMDLGFVRCERRLLVRAREQ